MKEYVKLTASAYAYYSRNEYHEEVFLPKEVWDEIKSNFRMEMSVGELDGKHSEVSAEIDVEVMTEKELIIYQPSESQDGDTLFDHIYEYLDPAKYNNHYLLSIQEEVKALCQVETISIVIPKHKKDEVIKLLEDFLVYQGFPSLVGRK